MDDQTSKAEKLAAARRKVGPFYVYYYFSHFFFFFHFTRINSFHFVLQLKEFQNQQRNKQNVVSGNNWNTNVTNEPSSPAPPPQSTVAHFATDVVPQQNVNANPHVSRLDSVWFRNRWSQRVPLCEIITVYLILITTGTGISTVCISIFGRRTRNTVE